MRHLKNQVKYSASQSGRRRRRPNSRKHLAPSTKRMNVPGDAPLNQAERSLGRTERNGGVVKAHQRR